LKFVDFTLMIHPDWQDVKNILAVRLDNLGDVLMTQPALRALKRSLPQARLTLLTSSMGRGIARMLPEINEVMVFDVPWVKLKGQNIGEEKVLRFVEDLKNRKFDAVIIFTNFSQTPFPAAFLCYLAGIPRVLGYSRENPYQLINYWLPDHEPFVPVAHGVQRQLDLVRLIGATTKDDRLCLAVPAEAKRAILERLNKEGFDHHKPWIVIHAGVSEPKRQYPLRNFAKVAELVTRDLGLGLVLTGNEEEKAAVRQVAASARGKAVDFSGQLSLAELVALIGSAKLLISNNTGPVHIAAAVQTPVVDLYARTNPEHTPWKVRHKTLYFDVPSAIRSKNTTLVHSTPKKSRPTPSPKQVVAAAKELLGLQGNVRIGREVSTWS